MSIKTVSNVSIDHVESSVRKVSGHNNVGAGYAVAGDRTAQVTAEPQRVLPSRNDAVLDGNVPGSTSGLRNKLLDEVARRYGEPARRRVVATTCVPLRTVPISHRCTASTVLDCGSRANEARPPLRQLEADPPVAQPNRQDGVRALAWRAHRPTRVSRERGRALAPGPHRAHTAWSCEPARRQAAVAASPTRP